MTLLILGLVIFLGVHSVRIVADDWRSQRIAQYGERRWKITYALISVVGLMLVAYGYGVARQTPVVLYTPPMWMRHLGSLLTVPAFILLTAAYVSGTRIKRAVGHPMVLGVKLWAIAHLLANGTLADVLLFGSFLVWAVFDYRAARRRDRVAERVYIAGPPVKDAIAVVIGIVTWALFALWLHGPVIGTRPFS